MFRQNETKKIITIPGYGIESPTTPDSPAPAADRNIFQKIMPVK